MGVCLLLIRDERDVYPLSCIDSFGGLFIRVYTQLYPDEVTQLLYFLWLWALQDVVVFLKLHKIVVAEKLKIFDWPI